MRIILLGIVLLSGCSGAAPSLETTRRVPSEECVQLPGWPTNWIGGLWRCESAEVVCYISKEGMQCKFK